MVTNGGDTEGLFRGAFMQSGAVMANGDVTLGQQDYDDLVRAAGCAGVEDTLGCLRQVPFSVLKAAVDMAQGFYSYRVCHDSPTRRAQLRTLFAVGESCLGSEGGWDVPQSPTSTVGITGQRLQYSVRHR